MSKTLSATCVNNVVTADGIVVGSVTILSKGKASSSGVLILDKERGVYITSSATDIEATLTKLAAIVTKICDTLTAIGAVTGPSWTPPPAIATNVADLLLKVADLNTLKASLK